MTSSKAKALTTLLTSVSSVLLRKNSYKALLKKRAVEGFVIVTKSSEMKTILFFSLILVHNHKLIKVFTIKRNRHVNLNLRSISCWDSFNFPYFSM